MARQITNRQKKHLALNRLGRAQDMMNAAGALAWSRRKREIARRCRLLAKARIIVYGPGHSVVETEEEEALVRNAAVQLR